MKLLSAPLSQLQITVLRRGRCQVELILFLDRRKEMLAFLLVGALAGVASLAETGAAPAPETIPRFVDATAVAGLDHMFRAEDPAFVVGGGVATLDCDQNGAPDLFFAGGDGEVSLFRNVSRPAAPIALKRVEGSALGAPSADLRRATGAYALDVDADGRDDIFVMRFGRNRLLRGLGDCRFEDATDQFGLPERSDWTAAFAAMWRAGDTLPILAIGAYVDRDRPLAKRGNCDASYLLAPDPTSPKRYGAPIELAPRGCALSMLFVDWSGDGPLDLRIANDRQYADPERGEQLFRISSAGDDLLARALDDADGWLEPRIWGMGLAAVDLDGDARPEIAATNMADNRLDALSAAANGAPTYENQALTLGVMSQRPYVGPDLRPSTSWHVAFEDFNNDGFWDLWIVKGNVDAMPQFASFDPDSLLLGVADGGFVEVGFEAGLALPGQGRGGAAIDLNADGRLDLVTVNRNGPARLHQSIATGVAGNWIGIRLQQPGPNRRAVGALVEVAANDRVLRRARSVGGGHAGGASGPLHFGLADAVDARVRVRWPDQAWSAWTDVSLNQVNTIERAAAAADQRLRRAGRQHRAQQ